MVVLIRNGMPGKNSTGKKIMHKYRTDVCKQEYWVFVQFCQNDKLRIVQNGHVECTIIPRSMAILFTASVKAKLCSTVIFNTYPPWLYKDNFDIIQVCKESLFVREELLGKCLKFSVTFFSAMKNVVLPPMRSSNPVTFTNDGVIEHVELNLLNVRQATPTRSTSRRHRQRFRWDKVLFSLTKVTSML